MCFEREIILFFRDVKQGNTFERPYGQLREGRGSKRSMASYQVGLRGVLRDFDGEQICSKAWR